MSDTRETRKPGAALLIDLVENLEQKVVDHLGVQKDKAKDFSEEVAAFIAEHWGGQIVYIPKDVSGIVRSRNVKIYAEFNGSNHSALARKYGLALNTIYDIIRSEREKNRDTDTKPLGLPLD